MNDIIQFLIRAKQNTYAGGGGKVDSSRKLSKDLVYKEGDYEYLDSYFGSYTFSGQEVVYHHSKPIWSMNYFGKTLKENQNSDVIMMLKESLLLVNEDMPYRGPEYHEKLDMQYYCKVDGGFSGFTGEEKIVRDNEIVYKLNFHGGFIK